jgi:hypothetical protein
MSFRLRKPNGDGDRRAIPAGLAAGPPGRTDAVARRDSSSRTAAHRSLPPLGAVLLALVVVVLLTVGLHVLFQ